MGIDLIKDMADAIKATVKQQERTSPYDTSAEVRHIEGGTAHHSDWNVSCVF